MGGARFDTGGSTTSTSVATVELGGVSTRDGPSAKATVLRNYPTSSATAAALALASSAAFAEGFLALFDFERGGIVTTTLRRQLSPISYLGRAQHLTSAIYETTELVLDHLSALWGFWALV
jgi:hypothetical protein